jgi:hypothetical protein
MIYEDVGGMYAANILELRAWKASRALEICQVCWPCMPLLHLTSLLLSDKHNPQQVELEVQWHGRCAAGMSLDLQPQSSM